MKKWFYENVVVIYLLTMVFIIGGTLGYLHSIVSAKCFDALCSIAFVFNFIIVVSSIFVGIWGENKIEKLSKREKV